MSVFDTDVLDANNSSTNESSTNTIENVETGQSEAKKTNKKVNAKKLIASNTALTALAASVLVNPASSATISTNSTLFMFPPIIKHTLCLQLKYILFFIINQ